MRLGLCCKLAVCTQPVLKNITGVNSLVNGVGKIKHISQEDIWSLSLNDVSFQADGDGTFCGLMTVFNMCNPYTNKYAVGNKQAHFDQYIERVPCASGDRINI